VDPVTIDADGKYVVVRQMDGRESGPGSMNE
jgi:hypothetical protein